MKKIKYVLITLIAIVASLLLFLGQDPKSNISKEVDTAPTLIPLTVGYSRLRISLPVFVAKELGIFERNGLDVSMVMYDTAQPLMQALVERQVDVAGYTALPITYNAILRSGTSLIFITTMIEDKDHRISYLLKPVSSDKDNEISSIQDLKGKTIGILPTVAYKAWIEEIVRKNGLDPDKDLQLRPLAPAQQAFNLQNGTVDALFTNDPAATSAIKAGIAELVNEEIVEVPYYIEDPFPFGSFNVTKIWADENPEIYKKLVASLNEAVDYVNDYPSEAKETMKKYLPPVFADDVLSYPNARYLKTSDSTEEVFQNIANKYFEMKIIPSTIDLSGFIESGQVSNE
ncbi:ABC transporter substrate-binding protein [Alteromonas lipotrueae]|uniref:ABC transporter substrate-binding protein n=1 Tax=Alteromonas lipotrueae TaxID=2803814 RepID=UPI001C447ADD|nr:ABC transporter substrate-binding protein [Alteromonas lipotrueae]